ncbi:nucleoside recognition domain-containing protein [Ravibacter arvi]|uniref:Nucleoside recognition domain-containing protein n=1 Tax=Ravibacter arvi TaxID=2051041 RepID=A0ABP8LRP6_9BACT
MALNVIFVGFFGVAFLLALFQVVVNGDTQAFQLIVESMLAMSKTAVMDIALPLTGIMTFFLGILNVGEKAGIIGGLAKIIGPFFNKLFPEVPKDHPANGQMIMNFSANMLGLDNAATPFGLKAMQSLQELNPDKDTASNAQIMFLVLHTSGLCIIPLTIIAQRAILGAGNPSDIFIPCVVGTYVTTIVSMVLTALWQKINLWNRTFLLGVGGATLAIALFLFYLGNQSKEQIEMISVVAGNALILLIVAGFLFWGIYKKINVFEVFIEGAKGGFSTAVTIIPYLVGLLVAIAAFRACGAMDYFVEAMRYVISLTGINTDFTEALPVALMRPLSGSGSRALMIEAMQTHGPDSFIGRLSCIFQGSADTTFYIVALYFGSVGIKNTRYAIVAGLLADMVGVVTAIFLAYMFFH